MTTVLELAAPGLAAMMCLVLASGFFSASETALFYLSHDELRTLRVGRPNERAAAVLLANPDRLLTAILFWNLVVNLIYFATSVVVTQRLVASGENAIGAAFGIAALFGIILFGEVLPKSIAVVYSRRLASLISWPLAAAVRVLDPLLPALSYTTLVVRRTFWPHIVREPYLQAEDLERAVEASNLSNQVIQRERQVLHNILDLSEITAEEVMRPRGTYITLPPPVHRADLKGEVSPGDFVAIQEDESEDIESAIPLASFSSLPEKHLEHAAEDVVHVPWCARLADTLELLRNRFCSVATVVNEYGETIGVVTYEDIIDTVLAPEPSRAKRLLRREPVVELEPGRFQVEGITTLRYLCRRLGIEYEPASEGLVTVAGMLHEELEHIPVVGDHCTWRGYRIEVMEVSNRAPLRVLLTKEGSETQTHGEETI